MDDAKTGSAPPGVTFTPMQLVRYEKVSEKDGVEQGFIRPPDADRSGATHYVEIGGSAGPGLRRLECVIPLTGKGPARVASNAYRDGWDAVFSGRSKGASN